MNKPNKCKNCEWYGKPYWSIINPCDNCQKEEVETINVRQYGKTYQMMKEMQQQIDNLNNVIYDLECTLREIIHYCNHLHNDCKYNLNDGHIRKIKNICKRKLEQRGVSDKQCI